MPRFETGINLSKLKMCQTDSVCPASLAVLTNLVTGFPLPVPVTPISTPGCLYQFGIYPESAQCSNNYIKCAHGVPYPTPCEPGLAYDDKTHSCNWPDLLLDFCNPEGNATSFNSSLRNAAEEWSPITPVWHSRGLGFTTPPGKCQDKTLNSATTSSLHILLHLLCIDFPINLHYNNTNI